MLNRGFSELKKTTAAADDADSAEEKAKRVLFSASSAAKHLFRSDADNLTLLDMLEGPRYHKPVALVAGA